LAILNLLKSTISEISEIYYFNSQYDFKKPTSMISQTKNRRRSSSSVVRKNNNFSPFFRLLPNFVTLSSLCLTLTAISFSIKAQYLSAVSLLIVAGVMDGIDGRLARFLNSTSDFGAQLDSLVDFVNFGIAPVFVIYFWINSYGEISGLDWAMVLFFAICMATRLARFNVDLVDKNANPVLQKYFFKGVPAPVGAVLAILPMILFFEFGEGFYCNQPLVIFYVFAIAALLVSRLPTISIKKIPIKNDHINLTLLLIGLMIIGFVIRPWVTMIAICLIYFLSIPVSVIFHRKLLANFAKIENEKF